MHLFLDTNVYLGCYKLSGDDLEELRKLAVAVRSGETTLYITPQVRDEFNRNREGVIAESLKTVESAKLPAGFPRLLQNYDEYPQLREALTSYEEHRGSLLATVREEAARRELAADKLIAELFDIAEDLPMSPAIHRAARRRFDLGNPPGKDNSYGDAINWESLLAGIPEGEALLFVADDKDYTSALDTSELKDFLKDEWAERKDTHFTLYKNLTALFRAHYPDIQLAAELEKELAVGRLVGSENFLQTHAAIRDVSAYADLSPEQAQALLTAANRNTQVFWIREDEDVQAFFTRLAHEYEHVLDDDDLQEFWAYYEEPPRPGDEDGY